MTNPITIDGKEYEIDGQTDWGGLYLKPQPNQQELRKKIDGVLSAYSKWLDGGNGIDKQQTTDQLLQLFQSAITVAKREMVECVRAEVIGEAEPNHYGGVDYTRRKEYRNSLRSDQRLALIKLTNEIAEEKEQPEW